VRPKLKLCVNTRMENLTAISDFVASATKKLDLGEETAFAIWMAVDEACANVIEHAYGGMADAASGTMCITLKTVTDSVVITIHDHGRPFDPQSVVRPDVTAPLEKRGDEALGLFLMERLMDSVEFQFDAVSGNTLTMKKRLSHGK
jgi:anti-sigma regulatory factor (Ser/Thr protein kinase)